MSTQPKGRMTPAEYLTAERQAEVKSEYLDGELYAMSGVTREHSAIVINITRELSTQVMDRPCEIHGPDMRVKDPTGSYLYPDVVAVCGDPEFEDADLDTLINPQVIIEVLSTSTESYDRGKKFAHYRRIESLQEYFLVSQTECRVERYTRQEDGQWLFAETVDRQDSVDLASIACRLSLSSIYHKVSLQASVRAALIAEAKDESQNT